MPADTSQPDKVTLTHSASGSSAVVQLYGATLVSWKPGKDGKDRIFVSPRAVLNGTKAIRGGIPLVFPQFGTVATSKLPQHGFARTSMWAWKGVLSETSDSISAAFSLSPSQVNTALFELWPFPFTLTYVVTLLGKDRIETKLVVENVGEKEFEFTALLHTYFTVKDIAKTEVVGLKGCTYADKTKDGAESVDTNPAVTFPGEIDRTYANVPGPVSFEGAHGPISLTRSGLNDVVVWNPSTEKSKAMADLGEEAFPKFVCVEAGQVTKPVKVAPGQTWEGGQVVTAL